MWRIGGIGVLLLVLSCDPPQRNSLSPETRTELDLLAEDNYRETEEKFFIVAEKLAIVLKEAMNKGNANASMEHLRKFASDNQLALDLLKEEIDEWQKIIPEEDRQDFMMRMVTREYIFELQRLDKQFRQRVGNNPTYLTEFEQLMGTIEFRK